MAGMRKRKNVHWLSKNLNLRSLLKENVYIVAKMAMNQLIVMQEKPIKTRRIFVVFSTFRTGGKQPTKKTNVGTIGS